MWSAVFTRFSTKSNEGTCGVFCQLKRSISVFSVLKLRLSFRYSVLSVSKMSKAFCNVILKFKTSSA